MILSQSRRTTRQFVPPKLQITSMMDMFTIILIFLLFSYSENPENVKLDKGMELPSSTAQLDYNDKIKLIVSQKNLKLGDHVIGKLKNGEVVGLDPNHLQNSTLYKELKILRENEDKEEVDPDKKKTILFLCDRRLSFKTINSIMKTAGMAGYPNLQFGVLKK